MKVYLGSDHRGYNLKEIIKKWLYTKGFEVVDCGNKVYDQKDDYPDFAFAVADNVVSERNSRGIVICGSGGGVTMAANKVNGVRCAQGHDISDVTHNRAHDDMNILAIGSDYVKEAEAKAMVEAFLNTPFENQPRFTRRLKKISKREK